MKMFAAYQSQIVKKQKRKELLLPRERLPSTALLFVSKSPLVSLPHGKLPNDELPGIKHF